MKLNFFEGETSLKIKLYNLLEQLNHRHNGAETVIDFVGDCIVDSEEQDLSTQFLQLANAKQSNNRSTEEFSTSL